MYPISANTILLTSNNMTRQCDYFLRKKHWFKIRQSLLQKENPMCICITQNYVTGTLTEDIRLINLQMLQWETSFTAQLIQFPWSSMFCMSAQLLLVTI